ncbi:hypothetical protein UlMin_026825 [Ulmus minor]
MGSKTEVLVFTDTNLDTHLVISIHPEITAGDFKRKLKIMHSNCFPESGEIEVCGLMVKKKSRFYHLPDSIPMKCAFVDVRGDWFLQVEARSLNGCDINGNSETKDCVTSSAKQNNFQGSESETCLEEVSKPLPISKNRESAHGNEKECLNGDAKTSASLKEVEAKDQRGSSSMVEVAPTEMSSGVKSVTSIINRYFPCSSKDGSSGTPTSSEVTSNIRRRKKKRRRTKRVDNLPNLLPPPVPKKSPHGTLGDELNEDEIGKRLVIASSNLGISPIYRCRLGNGKVMGMKPCSSVSRSVFEISESDE